MELLLAHAFDVEILDLGDSPCCAARSDEDVLWVEASTTCRTLAPRYLGNVTGTSPGRYEDVLADRRHRPTRGPFPDLASAMWTQLPVIFQLAAAFCAVLHEIIPYHLLETSSIWKPSSEPWETAKIQTRKRERNDHPIRPPAHATKAIRPATPAPASAILSQSHGRSPWTSPVRPLTRKRNIFSLNV